MERWRVVGHIPELAPASMHAAKSKNPYGYDEAALQGQNTELVSYRQHLASSQADLTKVVIAVQTACARTIAKILTKSVLFLALFQT